MEENKEIMQNEAEVEENNEVNTEETGNGMGIAVVLALGAAIGVAAYKGIGFGIAKIRSWKDSRKEKADVVVIDDAEVTDAPEE